jgi:hypothetical protein
MTHDRSITEHDAGRYEAAHAHDADAPDPADARGLDETPRWQPTATCAVCGQGVIDPLWCATCANDKAALLRERHKEWFA